MGSSPGVRIDHLSVPPLPSESEAVARRRSQPEIDLEVIVNQIDDYAAALIERRKALERNAKDDIKKRKGDKSTAITRRLDSLYRATGLRSRICDLLWICVVLEIPPPLSLFGLGPVYKLIDAGIAF